MNEPNWEKNGQQSVGPGQNHRHLGDIATGGHSNQNWKTDLIGDEFDAAGIDDEADKIAGILNDGKKALQCN
jgi:hypothetical protein